MTTTRPRRPPPRPAVHEMSWLPMCGQTWLGAAMSFVGMWAVMMVAMMLPSLAPTLWRYRLTLGAQGQARAVTLTAMAGAGYFFVWAVAGAIVFAFGAMATEVALQLPTVARAAPFSFAMVVLLAGAFQFSGCKAQSLAWCRHPPTSNAAPRPNAGTAWRFGAVLGLQCNRACAGLTAILLVVGVMDLRAMVLIAAAITAERLAPDGQRVAWAVGAVSIALGVYLMARGAWPV